MIGKLKSLSPALLAILIVFALITLMANPVSQVPAHKAVPYATSGPPGAVATSRQSAVYSNEKHQQQAQHPGLPPAEYVGARGSTASPVTFAVKTASASPALIIAAKDLKSGGAGDKGFVIATYGRIGALYAPERRNWRERVTA